LEQHSGAKQHATTKVSKIHTRCLETEQFAALSAYKSSLSVLGISFLAIGGPPGDDAVLGVFKEDGPAIRRAPAGNALFILLTTLWQKWPATVGETVGREKRWTTAGATPARELFRSTRSNRGGGGGNKAVGALDGKGRLATPRACRL